MTESVESWQFRRTVGGCLRHALDALARQLVLCCLVSFPFSNQLIDYEESPTL
ncbi:hypothetical protein M433DRAFT_10317 [Acidomyces richmondensis BFW]|nr:hypothetical protein M433DRAFT_10317 [Acidomyces richmondensis BFW]